MSLMAAHVAHLERELARAEREHERLFTRLVDSDVATREWREADAALRDVEQLVTALRARLEKRKAEARGERHLRVVCKENSNAEG